MRVAVLAPEFFPVPPVRGGATETVIEEITRRLPGHQVYVLGVADPQLPMSETLGHRTFHRYRPGLWGRLAMCSWRLPFRKSSSFLYCYPYAAWALGRLKRIRPDVVWVHSRLHWVPRIRRALPEARIILSLHNESNLRDTPVWNSAAIHACDVITACSRSLADTAVDKYPALRNRISVLHNGVDPVSFSNDPGRAGALDTLRGRLGLQGKKVLLFVGRLVQEKGVHLLLEAFASLSARYPDLRLVLAGAKTFSDAGSSPYIETLKRMAAPLGDRIVFAGHIPRDEVPLYFSLADILMFPSVWKEPFGMVVVEAMAAELPVIAFRHGGPAEILSHEKDGVLVPFRDGAAGLAAAAERLLADEGLARAMGKAARETVMRHFTWQHIAARFVEIAAAPVHPETLPGLLIAESGSGFGGTAKYLAQLAPLVPQDQWQMHLTAYAKGPFVEALERGGWAVGYRTGWRFPGPIDEDHASDGDRALLKLLKGLLRIPARVPEILAYLKARNIQVIHLNNEVLSHLPLVAAGKLAGCRILCHLHGWRPFTRLEKLALRFIDKLVCISETGAEYFRRELGGREVIAVPNGMDPSVVPEDMDLRRIAERERLKLEPGRRVFLLAGRLGPWKGQEVFLEALAVIRRKHPEVLGLVVGHDPSPDGYYLKQLQKKASERDLDEHVRFLPWQQDVWSIYAACDAVVHASSQPEPFGLVILEAMLACKPVIATKAGGVVDLVRDGVSGLMVPPGDPAMLAGAIGRYMENPKEAASFAAAGRKRAETLFTMKRNAEQIAALYQELL